MTEYIDREAVYNTLKAKYCDECTDEKCQMCEYAEIMFVLDNLPIADVQPVKRGKWETWGYIFHGIEWVRCSRCGKPVDVSYFKLLEGKIEPATLSICGCCGARMDGDSE